MSSIFILTGEHVPDKEARIRAIIEKKLAASTRAQGLEVYHAGDVPMDEIVAALSTGSLFGGDSLILVRGCEAINSASLEQLAPLMTGPPPSNTLILEGKSIGGKLSDKHPFSKAVNKPGEGLSVERFPVPRDYEIPRWLVDEARKRFNRSLDEKGAALFVDRVGHELHALLSELTKIDIVLPAGKPITATVIEEYTALSRACEPWDLPPVVARKEVDSALLILRNLTSFNIQAVQMVAALSDYFLRLLQLRSWFEEQPGRLDEMKKLESGGIRSKDAFNDLMAKACNESGFAKRLVTPKSVYPMIVLPKVPQQISSGTVKDLQYCVQLLTTAEWELKSGGRFSNDYASMERLVMLLLFSHRFKTTTKF